MFLNSKKRKMFLKQYTFLCFLFVGERNGGKEIRSNVEAAVNSLIFLSPPHKLTPGSCAP